MKTVARISLAVFGIIAMACSRPESGAFADASKEAAYDVSDGMAAPGGDYGPGEGQGGGAEAGVVTAAEWNDLLNWDFWGKLMTGDYSKMNGYWGFNTSKRIAVKLVSEGDAPVVGVSVKLLKGEECLWETISDNKGEANLWLAVNNVQDPVSVADCRVVIDGAEQPDAPSLWAWDATEPVINEYTVASSASLGNTVDIAFIVDATGSMGDEISFLKSDLQSILTKVGEMETDRTIFTGTVFYRDSDGDEYLTRFSPFTKEISSTMDFIGKQYADGGGDTPEAVHSALEAALTDLQWHSTAYAKMAFLILDAPAHRDHPGVIESLQKSVRQFASMGVKLIPVFCSSYEKECEFMCRQFAILTGGTYVFLTNDSGVGGDHIQASVGDYQVEHLNTLMVRLITKYIQ
jgi:hypothetical protein